MTEKRFWCLDEYKGETSPIVDGKFAPTNEWLCNKLNELHEENEQLKSFKSRVFNLLQDGIREESELLDYYIKEKAPCNADRQQVIIGVLKRLQKELK